MQFQDGWLEEMLEAARDGALVCSPWHNYDMSKAHCYGVDFVWTQKSYGGITHKGRRKRPRARSSRVPMILGACYMMQSESYHQIGGFSPLYRTWGLDEQDLSIRAWLAGKEVRCANRAVVGHLDSKDGSEKPWAIEGWRTSANHILLLKTVFEESSWPSFAPFYEPFAPEVEAELTSRAAEIQVWRELVQSTRVRSDKEFFQEFGRRWGVSPLRRPSISRKLFPAGWAAAERAARPKRPELPLPQNLSRVSRHRLMGLTVELSWPENEPEFFHSILPWPAEPIETSEPPDFRLEVLPTADGFQVVSYHGLSKFVSNREHALLHLKSALYTCMMKNSPLIHFRAAALEKDGKLLILQRRSADGLDVLIDELLALGFQIWSDSDIVFNPDGSLMPLLFTQGVEQVCQPRAGMAKASLVTSIRLRPGSRWRPRVVPPTKLVKSMLERQYLPGAQWHGGLSLLSKVCEHAEFIESLRDCPKEAARGLLRRLDRILVAPV